MIKINKSALKCPNCRTKVSILEKSLFTVNWVYDIRCKRCGEKTKLSKLAFLFRIINASVFILPIIWVTMAPVTILLLIGMYVLIEFVVIVFFAPLKPKNEEGYLIKQYMEFAKSASMTDCGDKASSKTHNRAAKGMKRIARSIENNYCDRKYDFALLLDNKEHNVCVWAARNMLEVMEYDSDLQRRALDVIEEAAHGDHEHVRANQMWLDNWYSKKPHMRK